MLRGYYTAASGMLTQQRKTEMLANNLANISTPGYKADQTSLRAFPDMLLKRIDQKEGGFNIPVPKTIGSINNGVYLQDATPLFRQGDIKETSQKTDVALLNVLMPPNPETGIEGSVFFTVENANGETRYTRNGNFTLDGAGYLTTASGQYILDEQGNRIQLNSDQFTIDEQGYITENNVRTARLGIAYSNSPLSLVKEGDGLFRAEGTQLTNAYNTNGVMFKTQQGFLEQSNVDASQTMTEMMAAYRTFEANQKVLQAYDTSLQKAVNEVGRIG